MQITTILPSGEMRTWEVSTSKLTYAEHWDLLRDEIEKDGGPDVSLLEFVRVEHDGREKTLIVDENGIMMGRPINPKASEIYGRSSPIFGAALLVDGKKFDILD